MLQDESQHSSDWTRLAREWKAKCFLRLGFDCCDCELLAEADADHHAVRKMLENGCSKELALRIVL